MEYINPAEMRAIDINASHLGVTFRELMDNAGRAVAEEVQRVAGRKGVIVMVCGPGNNGGDGLVAARYLHKAGHGVRVYLVGSKKDLRTAEAKEAYKALEESGVNIIDVQDARGIELEGDVVVDGLLGTGIQGEPRAPYREIIDKINKAGGLKVSIDLPSGHGSNTVVASDMIVALHKAKEGTGEIGTIVRSIGIPEKAETFVGPGDLVVNLCRRPDSHKGENGRLMIVGGSKDYYGAPVLTGLGALSAGCDLVTLFVPESIMGGVRPFSPDLIIKGYEGDYLNPTAVEGIVEFARGQDALVIGPGLGTYVTVEEALNSILSEVKVPVVADADALSQLNQDTVKSNWVVTPHAAEFKVLTGEKPPRPLEKRVEVIGLWAKKLRSTILLKSQVDTIASPKGKVRLNDTGNPGMTVGGTGDVLAGLVGGFIAQGIEGFKSACIGAYVNGAAADTLYQFKGLGYTASDLAREIPYTIKRTLDSYS